MARTKLAEAERLAGQRGDRAPLGRPNLREMTDPPRFRKHRDWVVSEATLIDWDDLDLM